MDQDQLKYGAEMGKSLRKIERKVHSLASLTVIRRIRRHGIG